MALKWTDFEIPLLQALEKLNGSGKTTNIYPVVEGIMKLNRNVHPEEYQKYKKGQIVWINKLQWAREYLKRKGQLDGSEHGIWKITPAGRERMRISKETARDPDEGLVKLHGIDSEVIDTAKNPEKAFQEMENIRQHETGDILGVKGIVYEPINEQGVILLFAALAYELGFQIEAVRSEFPDALLRRKNIKGNWTNCKVGFEYKSSSFKTHGHNPKQCNLIICWEHDWKECPIEVICLKEISKKFKESSPTVTDSSEWNKRYSLEKSPTPSDKKQEVIYHNYDRSNIFTCRGKDVEAHGQFVNSRLVVLKGSQAVLSETKSIPPLVKEIRDKLKRNGIVIEERKAYIFTSDYAFDSPSAAAGVVLSRSANGLIEWKDEAGKTLRQLTKR